jgi:hypothetical protein
MHGGNSEVVLADELAGITWPREGDNSRIVAARAGMFPAIAFEEKRWRCGGDAWVSAHGQNRRRGSAMTTTANNAFGGNPKRD